MNTLQQRINSLTERELEVLQQLCSAKSNREIADTLGISIITVRHHISSMLGKLDADDRTALVIVAFREKIGGITPQMAEISATVNA